MKTDSGQNFSDVNDPWSHLHLRGASVRFQLLVHIGKSHFKNVSELVNVLNPVGWKTNITFLSPFSRIVFD